MDRTPRECRVSVRVRAAFLTAALGLALLIGAAPVAADTTTGTVGSYSLVDTRGKPGSTCNYTDAPPTHYLVSFTVRGPSVLWPASNSASSGKVGWWAVVQHHGNAGWVTVKTGASQTATASKTTAAAFAKRVVKYAAPNDDPYRVVAHIAWYRADDSVLGSATHVVAHYHGQYAGWSLNTSGSCVGKQVILG